MASGPRRFALTLLFVVSGAPGLAAQLSWTRVFTAGLGHELPSLLGVVSAFFAGLALGAWWFDRRISRSGFPVRWYAGLELFSAGWIAASTTVLDAANQFALNLAGAEASPFSRLAVAFLVPLGIVGPAAAAMGGTLPAMERAVRPLVPDGRAVAVLYAGNTLGAVIGVLGAVFVLMPAVGFRGTLWLAASVQALAGVAALVVARSAAAAAVPHSGDPEASTRESRRAAVRAFGTGFLGMGYELLGVRALAQTTENTIHTFALVLAVFLAGTAAGSALQRVARRRGSAPEIPTLLGGLAVLATAGILVLAFSLGLLAGLRSTVGGLGAEALLAIAVFGGPTLLMGALFASIAESARTDRGGVGRVLAWNTLGGALAGPVFVCGLLPGLGLKAALVATALGYLAVWPAPPRPQLAKWFVWPVVAIGLALLLPARLRLVELPPGAELRWSDDGMLATVSVIRTADGHRALRVNNHFQQGGTATAAAAQRHALIPLLLHEEPGSPRRVLLLGVGTGITLGAVAAFPRTEAEGVDLLPGVIAALPEFEPENGGVARRPGFRVVPGDARRYVRTARARYDVIIADLFHPAEDGAGLLYTREHFAAIRARLNPRGLVCQWLPLHQLDFDTFRLIARTFVDVFPEAGLWLLRSNADAPVVGLVWRDGGLTHDWDRQSRFSGVAELAPTLRATALADPVRVYGSLLANPASLRSLAGSGPVATDDRPLVMFHAASSAYRGRAVPHRNLMTLLEAADPGFTAATWGSHASRLLAWRESRDRHLRGLALDAEGRRNEAIEAYVASAAASPDYTAGYAQAVLVASAWLREDPKLARSLLERLIRVRPEQRLARDVLARIGP